MAAGVVPQSSCSFRPHAPARTCSSSGPGRLLLPLPRKPRLIGNPSAAWSMRSHVPGAGRAGGGVGPRGRAGAAAEQGRQPAGQGRLDQLRTDEVDVAVDAAGRQDQVLAGDHFRAGADHQLRIDAGLDERVARLADADDPAVADADVALDDAPV